MRTPSTEDLLFEAMDRQALRFIEMLNDDGQDDDGNDAVDINLKLKLFGLGQDWLIRRQKLRPPSENETEGDGIRDMRAWINDPTVRGELDKVMFESGYVKAPPVKNGRPTNAEKLVRDRFKQFKESGKAEAAAQDDSGWSGMLEEKS